MKTAMVADHSESFRISQQSNGELSARKYKGDVPSHISTTVLFFSDIVDLRLAFKKPEKVGRGAETPSEELRGNIVRLLVGHRPS